LGEHDIERLKADMAAMHKRLQLLEDRAAILDCLTRYTHAIDRHDWEALREVYHPDGIANHGDFVGLVDDLRRFLEPRYEETLSSHTHHVLNHICDVDGDVANAVTGAIVVTTLKDGSGVIFLGARYVDRLERRDGKWKIALRRIVADWRCKAEPMPNYHNFPTGRWDREDLAYMRPLALTAELAAQLAAAAAKAG
jgi:ketosteroid isomerase-like protein